VAQLADQLVVLLEEVAEAVVEEERRALCLLRAQ
jgi:hypothetical protein